MIPINLENELTNLLYDCKKMDDNQAVVVVLAKCRRILKSHNSGNYNISFNPKNHVQVKNVTEEEQFFIDLENGGAISE